MTTKPDYSTLTQAFREYQDVSFLDRFCSGKLLPWQERVELSRWEKFKTWLPWSWSYNHKTKIVYRMPKNAPAIIKFVRHTEDYS